MKIIVFSDSHGDTESMSATVIKEKPDMIIHLGDNLKDAQKLNMLFPNIPIEWVRGNTDFMDYYITENHLLIKEKLVFITHGHTYRVKWSKKDVKQKGIDDNADIVLFGHTHESYLKQYENIWFMNPGSIGQRYMRKTSATYGIINILNNSIECNIHKFEIE
ncbi:MAG: YfcE family phosphodiesterase [Clostridiales bacterium]|nr:YfcE family phosphodiesterase [Clostridiales bacterium]